MQKLSVWKLLWVGGLCVISGGCSPESAAPPSAVESSQITAQQAVAGVGKKGQSLRDNTGLALAISAGPATLLNLEQKAVLEFQIPPAVQMFKATEGRFPKSHEEFMQKIIEPNRLVLPTLPDGAVYHFNSEKGELWVYPEAEVPH